MNNFYVLNQNKTVPLHRHKKSLIEAENLVRHMSKGGYVAHIFKAENGVLVSLDGKERIIVRKLERGAMTKECFSDFCLDVRFDAIIEEQKPQGINTASFARLQEIVEALGLDDAAHE